MTSTTKNPAPAMTTGTGEFKTQRGQATTANAENQDRLDAPHHRTEEGAIKAARLILHGLIDHGIKPEIDIAPDEMPDEETRQACIAIRAAVEAGNRELPEVLPHVMAHHPAAQSAVVGCTQDAAFASPLASLVRCL